MVFIRRRELESKRNLRSQNNLIRSHLKLFLHSCLHHVVIFTSFTIPNVSLDQSCLLPCNLPSFVLLSYIHFVFPSLSLCLDSISVPASVHVPAPASPPSPSLPLLSSLSPPSLSLPLIFLPPPLCFVPCPQSVFVPTCFHIYPNHPSEPFHRFCTSLTPDTPRVSPYEVPVSKHPTLNFKDKMTQGSNADFLFPRQTIV